LFRNEFFIYLLYSAITELSELNAFPTNIFRSVYGFLGYEHINFNSSGESNSTLQKSRISDKFCVLLNLLFTTFPLGSLI